VSRMVGRVVIIDVSGVLYLFERFPGLIHGEIIYRVSAGRLVLSGFLKNVR
jgi:hypothetical protein